MVLPSSTKAKISVNRKCQQYFYTKKLFLLRSLYFPGRFRQSLYNMFNLYNEMTYGFPVVNSQSDGKGLTHFYNSAFVMDLL